MLDLLKYANARLGEASSHGGLAMLAMWLHLNTNQQGVVSVASSWMTIICAALAVLLAEVGNKPALQIVADTAAALATGARTAAGAVGTVPAVVLFLTMASMPFLFTACSGSLTSTNASANVSQKIASVSSAVCQSDQSLQPVIVPLTAAVLTAVVPGIAPAIAGAVAIDTSAVHPAIVNACAGVGGKPVGAIVAPATPVPAAVPVPAPPST